MKKRDIEILNNMAKRIHQKFLDSGCSDCQGNENCPFYECIRLDADTIICQTEQSLNNWKIKIKGI
jgi:hypothetical protein